MRRVTYSVNNLHGGGACIMRYRARHSDEPDSEAALIIVVPRGGDHVIAPRNNYYADTTRGRPACPRHTIAI